MHKSPIARRKQGITRFARRSTCARSWTSTCDSAKLPVRRSRSPCSRRRSPAISAWRPSMRLKSMNATELARERTAELAASFGLLTRVPVAYLNLPDVRTADAVWAFPLAGAAVGVLGGAVYWLAHAIGCPPPLAALFTLGAMVLVT